MGPLGSHRRFNHETRALSGFMDETLERPGNLELGRAGHLRREHEENWRGDEVILISPRAGNGPPLLLSKKLTGHLILPLSQRAISLWSSLLLLYFSLSWVTIVAVDLKGDLGIPISHVADIQPSISPGARKSIQLTTTRAFRRSQLPPLSPALNTGSDATSPGQPFPDVAVGAALPQPVALMWPGTRSPGYAVHYHNGSVLTGRIKAYLLFYGNWSRNSGNDIAVIVNFLLSFSNAAADSLGPSVHKWWRLMQQYTQRDGSAVAAQVTVGKVVVGQGSYSKTLSDGTSPTLNDDIFGLVQATIDSGQFPLDVQGVYLVLTSPDISVGAAGQGFCSAYCAWHGWKTLRGVGIPYVFVGDPTQQCSTCGSSIAAANGYPGADIMVSSIGHEIAEAASNPNILTYDGWWSADFRGWQVEAGDLCNRVYRDDTNNLLYSDRQGTYLFNMYGLNGYRYLVQGLPNLTTQTCAVQADL